MPISDSRHGDQTQDLTYAPPMYPNPAEGAIMTWRPILADGRTVGVLSTDYQDSVQVSSIDQPRPVLDLMNYIALMREGQIPASGVYDAADLAVDSLELGDEQHGSAQEFQAAWSKLLT